MQDLLDLIHRTHPALEITPQIQVALLFFIEGDLGLMTNILQGKVDLTLFPPGHNAIFDNFPVILKDIFN